MKINNIIQMVNETLSLSYYQELLHTFEDVFETADQFRFNVNKANGKVTLYLTKELSGKFIFNEKNCQKLSNIKFEAIHLDSLNLTTAFETIASNIDNIRPNFYFGVVVGVNNNHINVLSHLTQKHIVNVSSFNIYYHETIIDMNDLDVCSKMPTVSSGHTVYIRNSNKDFDKVINCESFKHLKKYIDMLAFVGDIIQNNRKCVILDLACEEYTNTKDFNKFIDTLIEHDMEDWL